VIAIAKHLNATKPPEAIFCLKNSTTISTYTFLQKLKISVPSQMALIGFDDFELASTLRPSITVVQQPVEELGHTAAELLFQRLAPPKNIQITKEQKIKPIRLRTGLSSERPAVAAKLRSHCLYLGPKSSAIDGV
jgi:LacI family transcriptional regulator